MQLKQSFRIIHGAVILFSLAYIFHLAGFLKVDGSVIISYGMLLYGIISVYLSIGTGQKGFLFLNAVVFMTGVVLFVINYFVFLSPKLLLIPASYFVLSAGFLILYIDNRNEKLFLIISAVSFLVSVVIIISCGSTPFKNLLFDVSELILKYFPIVIVLIGLYLFFGKTGIGNNKES